VTRIGLLQNYLGLDGRSQTLASLIELLNQRGIVPDVQTFSGAGDEARFRSLTSADLRFKRRSLARPGPLLGDLLQELAMPYLFRSRLKAYDLVFTSATAAYGFPKDVRLLRLVCFPLEQVPRYEARYRRPLYGTYGVLCQFLYRLAARDCEFGGRWLANSEFTRGMMLRTYPLAPADIDVVYAPVATQIACRDADPGASVVSIGGFHEDKRQLEQIGMARRLPNVQFTLIGSVRSRGYFNRCVKAAEGLQNVELLPNASGSQIKAALGSAKVYLHSKRFEHFGISSVEGIAHGCVPIVHDSGGQREVVPFAELRYERTSDAADKLKAALDGEFDQLIPGLQDHIQNFSDDCFKARMGRILDEVLA
jgi:glycosyltransferase involved in cell wall biosynthesis